MEESKEENKKEIKLVEEPKEPEGDKKVSKNAQDNKANRGELDAFLNIRSAVNVENRAELKGPSFLVNTANREEVKEKPSTDEKESKEEEQGGD